ncbi:MAG: hypothetical protein R2830_17840 [Saprospiraceae bacterium]
MEKQNCFACTLKIKFAAGTIDILQMNKPDGVTERSELLVAGAFKTE